MADILDMTLDQINMYLMSCSRLDKRDMRNDIISALAGARYDEKTVQKLMRSLE